MSKIAVFGIGYVGCVTAACLSRDEHQVVGVDVDPEKVLMINAGETPIEEPGLAELIQREVIKGTLSATTDVQSAVQASEIGLVAVGTPSGHDGAVSSGAVEKVIHSIGSALKATAHEYVIVVRSTLLPGILEERLIPTLEEASGRTVGPGLRICNNPEFLRETTAIRDYDSPPYVLVGTTDDWNPACVMALYDRVDGEQIVTDSRTASLVKYACNAFHALKIAFANEIGTVAKDFQAEGQKVMELVCRDTKLNVSAAYLRPGFAFGGSCLPKDVRALTRHAEKAALRLNLLSAILPSNREHLQRAIDLIEQSGHRKIGLVGLSFKAGTDDLRESPFVTLVETLVGRGYNIRIYDPDVSLSRLRGRNRVYVDQHLPHLAALLVQTPQELYQHASLLLVGTEVVNRVNLLADYPGTVIDLRSTLITATKTAGDLSGH